MKVDLTFYALKLTQVIKDLDVKPQTLKYIGKIWIKKYYAVDFSMPLGIYYQWWKNQKQKQVDGATTN